jgi:hypothetical protein
VIVVRIAMQGALSHSHCVIMWVLYPLSSLYSGQMMLTLAIAIKVRQFVLHCSHPSVSLSDALGDSKNQCSVWLPSTLP